MYVTPVALTTDRLVVVFYLFILLVVISLFVLL